MADASQAPDEAAFRADLTLVDFATGEALGQWEVVELEWPYAFVWIAAAARPGAPERFWLRLRCAGYPVRGPTGAPWNRANSGPLEHGAWPKGRARFAHVFRTNWENGSSLYHPYDGRALEKHGSWPAQYPNKLWSRHRTIGEWLAEFHELLNCDEYEGV